MTTTRNAGPANRPLGPLLVFVLGAPCSGKSTLSTTLSARHNLTHISLGADLRSLTSSTPSNRTSHLESLLSATELATLRGNVQAGTLGPAHLTSKLVMHRVFPTDCDSQNVRALIDGFPRDVQRWEMFRELARPVWEPSGRAVVVVVVVLDVQKEVAQERFLKRGRVGDVFERRFEEYEKLGCGVVEGMSRDGVMVCVVKRDRDEDSEKMVEILAPFMK